MPRVSPKTMEKLNEFFDTLPTEARNKCALCNETLTHIVKSAEAQTGAPTATVTRELANRVNDGAAPGDVVSEGQLRGRVQRSEGIICTDHADKAEPNPKECPICKSVYPGGHKTCPNGCEKTVAEKKPGNKIQPPVMATEAMPIAIMAISQLERIRSDDPDKYKAFDRVTEWISEHRPKDPVIPNCHKRNLSTEERDDILFQVEKLYPGRDDGWKRACTLNEAGLKCGRDKKSFWTPKDFRDNLRHAKNRQADK